MAPGTFSSDNESVDVVNYYAPKTEAWNSQKDGTHYKTQSIQPMEYTMANNFNSLQHSIIKYISRYKNKNGVADLEKAKHCIQMLIDWENK